MIGITSIDSPEYHSHELQDSLAYYKAGTKKNTAFVPRWQGGLATALEIEGKEVELLEYLYLAHGFDPAEKDIENLKSLRQTSDREGLINSLNKRELLQLIESKSTNRKHINALKRSIKKYSLDLKDIKTLKDQRRKLEGAKIAGEIYDTQIKKMRAYSSQDEQQRNDLNDQIKSTTGGERCGVDVTFSVPKAYSVMYARANDAEKELLRQAIVEESNAVIARREAELVQTRRQVNGIKEVISGKGMWSIHFHDTARMNKDALELATDQEAFHEDVIFDGAVEASQNHVHITFMNSVLCEDGKYRALHSDNINELRRELDAEICAKVLNRVVQMGFALDYGEPEKNAVANFSSPKLEKKDLLSFSQRSLKIQQLKKKGVKNSDAASMTRTQKPETPEEVLYPRWQDHLELLGVTRQALGLGEDGLDVVNAVNATRAERLYKSQTYAEEWDLNLLERLTAMKTHFTDSDLRVALWQDAMKTGDMDIEKRLVRIQEKHLLNATFDPEKKARFDHVESGKNVYTTRFCIEQEERLDKVATAFMQRKIEIANKAEIAIAIASTSKKKSKQIGKPFIYRKDQQAVIEGILTNKSGFSLVQAPPGSGKTTMLESVVDFNKAYGFETIILAPSHKAKNQAMKDAGIDVGHAIQGFVKNKLDSIKENTVICVDESSMVGLEDMLALLEGAKQKNASVVLIGDRQQLTAVSRGDPFARIQDLFKEEVLQLTEITRQKDHVHRDYVYAQYEGRHAEFVQKMDDLGCIKYAMNEAEKRAQLVAYYFSRDDVQADEKVFTTGTNKDATELNALIRAERIARKEVSKDGVDILCEGTTGLDVKRFASGDRILFTKGIKDIADTSDVATIVSVEAGKKDGTFNFQVMIDGKGLQTFDSEPGLTIDYAYVMTTHRSQGLTVKQSAHYATPTTSGAEALLVGASRHKEDFALFITQDERNQLKASASRRTAKISARELIAEQNVPEPLKQATIDASIAVVTPTPEPFSNKKKVKAIAEDAINSVAVQTNILKKIQIERAKPARIAEPAPMPIQVIEKPQAPIKQLIQYEPLAVPITSSMQVLCMTNSPVAFTFAVIPNHIDLGYAKKLLITILQSSKQLNMTSYLRTPMHQPDHYC